MRGLSLWQPWASLVACGLKKIETRSWGTTYRGDVAVQAAMRWTRQEREFTASLLGWELTAPFNAYASDPGSLPRGEVVCLARLVNVVPMTEEWIASQTLLEKTLGGYVPGRFGWVLEDVRPCSVPLKGKQGLWVLSDEEERSVLVAASSPNDGPDTGARQGELF